MRMHFVGIGGIGMSALANFYLSRGVLVSGSDVKRNALTTALSEGGARIRYGHSGEHVGRDLDVVVFSTSIRPDNPELVRARSLGIPLMPRVRLLKEVLSYFPATVGVTGTHGKTTTSGILSHILWSCGLEPTALVGGVMRSFGSNARMGTGNTLVAEVDESDGYFRELSVGTAVLTNIEKEHMEHYGSFEEILESYGKFLENIPEDGTVVYNSDDPNLVALISTLSVRTVSFGLREECEVTCRNVTAGRSIAFDLHIAGRPAGEVRSALIGEHNVMNILAAVGCAWEMGLPVDAVVRAVSTFEGMERRFERVAMVGGVEVVQDYAHHPTEIRAVIKAARDYAEGRVITVFQPHRFSRTKALFEELVGCFLGSDIVFLTDIYAAAEEALPGVDSKRLLEKLDGSSFLRTELSAKGELPGKVAQVARDGDIVLVLGAGDICDVATEIARSMAERMATSKGE